MEQDKKPRKNYTPEFKEEALSRCEKIGTPKTSKELGINQATLNRWKKEKSNGELTSDKTKPTYEELEKDIRRLKKEIGYIKDINDVLKKSTAIFSSNQMGGFR